MTEKLPQKANNLERRSFVEGPPTVESMQIRHAGVLVRVIFPRDESVAKVFMLVQEPTSEQGMKNIKKLSGEHPEYDKKTIDQMVAAMNSVLIFRNTAEAQKWFDGFSYTCTPAERKTIADFLEVENADN